MPNEPQTNQSDALCTTVCVSGCLSDDHIHDTNYRKTCYFRELQLFAFFADRSCIAKFCNSAHLCDKNLRCPAHTTWPQDVDTSVLQACCKLATCAQGPLSSEISLPGIDKTNANVLQVQKKAILAVSKTYVRRTRCNRLLSSLQQSNSSPIVACHTSCRHGSLSRSSLHTLAHS